MVIDADAAVKVATLVRVTFPNVPRDTDLLGRQLPAVRDGSPGETMPRPPPYLPTISRPNQHTNSGTKTRNHLHRGFFFTGFAATDAPAHGRDSGTHARSLRPGKRHARPLLRDGTTRSDDGRHRRGRTRRDHRGWSVSLPAELPRLPKGKYTCHARFGSTAFRICLFLVFSFSVLYCAVCSFACCVLLLIVVADLLSRYVPWCSWGFGSTCVA